MKMNNNYGVRMTDNYRVLLNLMQKNRELGSSSEDSVFDSDYDGRLDDDFNRMIKERKENLVKKAPKENSGTPKESDGALGSIDSPMFTPSINSTMCSSISDETISQKNSSLAVYNKIVIEHDFLNLPQEQCSLNGIADIQQENAPHSQIVDAGDDEVIQRGTLASLTLNQHEANHLSVHEEIQQDPLRITLNQNDSTYVVHSRSVSVEQVEVEIEISPHVGEDNEIIEQKNLPSLNSTMTNGNESSWTDCDDNWTDCNSFADDEVFE